MNGLGAGTNDDNSSGLSSVLAASGFVLLATVCVAVLLAELFAGVGVCAVLLFAAGVEVCAALLFDGFAVPAAGWVAVEFGAVAAGFVLFATVSLVFGSGASGS